MNKNLYVDFHVLQTVPPSCVNRDDTGSPKTAVYGGSTRARVSAQAWKRAMRLMFEENLTKGNAGVRTRKVFELIKKEARNIDPNIPDDKLEETIKSVLKDGGVPENVLFFISALQIKALAEVVVSYLNGGKPSNKKEDLVKKALTDNPSFDILLFGRMAAGTKTLNYDAASQVAHSISTHTVSNEYDYFTAVDDFNGEDGEESGGAGHINTAEFNSSTLYRYSNINIRELYEKDGVSLDEIKNVVREFANAFVRSMPTGKQNSYANRTLPYLIYATVREDQPLNLVGAFERPVRNNDGGYENESEKALIKYAQDMYENYDMKPAGAWIVGRNESYELADKVKYNELLDKLVEEVGNAISK